MTMKLPKWPGSGLQKVNGYLRLSGRYISGNFLLAALTLFIVAGILYLTLAHQHVARLWYARQKLPEFTLNSPYLADYNGQAQLLLDDGSLLYEGNINGGVVQGSGKLYRNGLLLYHGEFREGKYNGQGTLHGDNGSLLYSGEFSDNLYHGSGKLYGEDGGVLYSGMFENGLFHGKGMLYSTEEERLYDYVGEFSEGVCAGNGKLFCGEALLYEGGFVNDVYEGQGKLWLEDGMFYEGSFTAGLYEGPGKLYKNGSLLYEGEFAAGLYNGNGTEYNPATGFKVFAGKYLAGERMQAGTAYDENGEAVAAAPTLLVPAALLGKPYEEVYTALVKGGANCRLIQPLASLLPLVDDAGGVVCAFTVAEEGGEPLYLAQVYLCSLSAFHNVVVGSDISQVELPADYTEIALGDLTGPLENIALSLSNLYWRREAKISQLSSVSFGVDNTTGLTLTAYYLAATADEFQAATAVEPPAGQRRGPILFLKAEYLSDGSER